MQDVYTTGICEGGQKTGIWKTFHPTGELYYEGEYIEDLKENEWKVYYPSGRIKQVGKYRAGWEVERWTFYGDKDGEVVMEGNFLKGLRDGEWLFYYPSGNIKVRLFYNSGLRQGWGSGFNEEGEEVERAFYRNDMQVEPPK
jgi:hypothetical protein